MITALLVASLFTQLPHAHRYVSGAAELWVETLVAQDTPAMIGWRVLEASQLVQLPFIPRALPPTDTTIGKTVAPAPALSDVQKLQLQTGAQHIEIAQLKLQVVQAELDKAREDLGRFITSLQVEGYTLDFQTLTYVAKPQETKPQEKKE